MAYSFYLGNLLFPVTPEKLEVQIRGRNETIVLMDQGEVNLLKLPGLTEVSFDVLLPNVRYPFALYPEGFRKASYYLAALEAWIQQKAVLQFVVTRKTEGGLGLHGTSMKVSLEEYTMKEEADKYGMDILVSLKLKQYRDYGVKTCQISGNTAVLVSQRETSGAPSSTSYQVQEGESLWEISRKCYGDGSRYTELKEANGITDPNRLQAGKWLEIPR